MLARLDSKRAAAFDRLDAALLTQVDAAGSAALTSDMGALRSLLAAGVHAEGLRSVVRSVRLLQDAGGRVTLAVTDVRPAYRLLHVDGSAAETRTARGPARWQEQLVQVRGEWMVVNVAPA